MGSTGIYVWQGAPNEPVPLGSGNPPPAGLPKNRVQVSELAFTSAAGTVTPPTANPRDALRTYGTYDGFTYVYDGYFPNVPIAGQPGDGIACGTRRDKARTPFNGDFKVTQNNQVIEDLEIFGQVINGAFTGTIIRNCDIWGPPNVPAKWGPFLTANVVFSNDDGRGCRIEDSRLRFWGNFWVQGALIGGNWTAERCEISGPDGVDATSKVGNIKLLFCWIHDGGFGEWDASKIEVKDGGDGSHPSSYPGMYAHVDGFQFHRGRGHRVRNCAIGGVRDPWDHHIGHEADINAADDMANSSFMIKQEVSNSEADLVDDVIIENTWVMGGAATVNITSPGASSSGPKNWMLPQAATTWTSPSGAVVQIPARKGVTLRNIRFGRSTWDDKLRTRQNRDGSIMDTIGQPYVLRDVNMAVLQNLVFDDDGTPVPVRRGGNYL